MKSIMTTIARRSTADGKHVLLWADGSLTWALGYAIKGSAYPRTEEQRKAALAAGWLVLGEVELYDADEVTALVRAARRVVKKSPTATPGDLRAEYARATAPRGPKPHWVVLQADAYGKPTCRMWALPRMSHSGLVIWHERGTYSVLRTVRGAAVGRRSRDVLEDTGLTARTLHDALRMADRLRVSTKATA